MKALLILDNTPAHPSESVLASDTGRNRVMFLALNATSVIHPMDQVIISALKRRFIRRYLDEVLIVLQGEAEDTSKNTHHIKTSFRSLQFCIKLRRMKVLTLPNCWKKLLQNEDIEAEF